MKNLSAFIIKINPLTEEAESNLDRAMYLALNANFTDEEQENNFILDEENGTMVVFIDLADKQKLNNVVNAAREIGPEVIGLYEDVTEKFLYQNDFTDYKIKSELITNYIKANLTIDEVFDKVRTLGDAQLSDADKEMIGEWAA